MNEKQILTLNPISDIAQEVLNGYGLSTECNQPLAILVRSFNMHKFDLPASVLAVARAGAGYNNIPYSDYALKGICVFNTPGANANGVKELVLASLLLASRNIIPATEWTKTLHNNVAKQVEKGKNAFAGTEIAGKRICVIGLGAIGKSVAKAAYALGMTVTGYDKYISDSAKVKLNFVTVFDDIISACHEADYVTLHIPCTDDTANTVNDTLIDAMKDGVILINTARAELADINAVKLGLKNNKIRAYVTDFPTEDTADTEGIIAIPHLGASTLESEDNCARMAAAQLKDYIENGNIKNSVNMPDVSSPRRAAHRVCIISRDSGENPYGGISATRAGIRYTIVDTDLTPDVRNYSGDGIIKVRVVY